jgi:sulfide:quinone oxidoreductase
VGDVTSVGTAKAGALAEGAARVVAAALIAQLRGGPSPGRAREPAPAISSSDMTRSGAWTWTFLSGPKTRGTLEEPSEALAAEKALFGSSPPLSRRLKVV